jgi:hypothetical protein
MQKSPLRTAGAVVGVTAFFVEPYFYGRSGLRIIDFGMVSLNPGS